MFGISTQGTSALPLWKSCIIQPQYDLLWGVRSVLFKLCEVVPQLSLILARGSVAWRVYLFAPWRLFSHQALFSPFPVMIVHIQWGSLFNGLRHHLLPLARKSFIYHVRKTIPWCRCSARLTSLSCPPKWVSVWPLSLCYVLLLSRVPRSIYISFCPRYAIPEAFFGGSFLSGPNLLLSFVSSRESF